MSSVLLVGDELRLFLLEALHQVREVEHSLAQISLLASVIQLENLLVKIASHVASLVEGAIIRGRARSVPENDHAELPMPSSETRWPEIVHNPDREFLRLLGVPYDELAILLCSNPDGRGDLVGDRGFEVRLLQEFVDDSQAIVVKNGGHLR